MSSVSGDMSVENWEVESDGEKSYDPWEEERLKNAKEKEKLRLKQAAAKPQEIWNNDLYFEAVSHKVM